MRTRWRNVDVVAGLVIAVLTALVGGLVNLVSRSGLELASSLASVVGVAVSFVAMGFALSAARQAKRSAEESKEALSSAQRQADSMDAAAGDAGVDPAVLYETVLRDSRIPAEVRFIYAWSRLEHAMRRQTRRLHGDDLTGLPFGRLINEFAEALGLTNDDKDALRDLLRLRNVLIHGDSRSLPSPYEIEAAIARVEEFVERSGDSFLGK